MSDRPSVAFVVRYVNQYREPFYRGLRDALGERGVDLELIHGDPSESEFAKKDSVTPSWTTFVANRFIGAGRREIVHQPVIRLIADKDLVIVEQASRLLLNYRLLFRRSMRRQNAVAFIGHGVNRASSPSRLGEVAKRWLTNRIDWFFAYTEGTKRILESAGVAPERITVFNNTLDLENLRSDVESVTQNEIDDFRAAYGLGQAQLVLTLGSLYPDKRPALAAATGHELAARGHDIHVMLIGSGTLEASIKSIASAEPWIHHLDAAFGHEKAIALRAAAVLLIPGVAGLVVLDGFAAGLPIVTADNPHHPPEIDYITNGQNGLIVKAPTADAFADAVGSVLEDDDLRQRLEIGAKETGASLTIDGMIERFVDGVIKALAATKP